MDIEQLEITVGELVEGYHDDGEGGVRGYGGRLDIRPPYQREFVYKPKERDAVIDTITKNYPLNVMYWAERGNLRGDGDYTSSDGPGDSIYEIIDGQQRTISVAQYVHGDFSFNKLYFHNLPADKQEQILRYELMVYVCRGPDSEKLEWFETVNIAGVELTHQELRNAVFAGTWLSDAKRYFSRNNGPAYQLGRHYLNGRVNRQEYLQTAIQWASSDTIEDYMGRHQADADANELWEHFQAVIEWVKKYFTTRRPAMKGVGWGSLYDDYKDAPLDAGEIEGKTARLVADEEIQNQSGIYPYILTGDERHLNLRAFPAQMKQRVYERQCRKCAACGKEFEISKMEADHITPWSEGGKTVEDNCQVLCKECNRRKGAR